MWKGLYYFVSSVTVNSNVEKGFQDRNRLEMETQPKANSRVGNKIAIIVKLYGRVQYFERKFFIQPLVEVVIEKQGVWLKHSCFALFQIPVIGGSKQSLNGHYLSQRVVNFLTKALSILERSERIMKKCDKALRVLRGQKGMKTYHECVLGPSETIKRTSYHY